MEDYEYIQLLIKKVKELKILKLDTQFSKEIAESIHILTVDPTIAESMFHFTNNGETLKLRRNMIADKIEELNQLIIQARVKSSVTTKP